MERAFTDDVIQSSQLDDYDSSEKENSPVKLSGEDVSKTLKSIPNWNDQISAPTVSFSKNKGIFIFSSLYFMYEEMCTVTYLLHIK